jgi:hypothetical protein
MSRLTRPLLLCGAALLIAACTRAVDGAAVAGPGAAPRAVNGVNVDEILLDQSRMRAIAGAGDDMTIIPTMDGTRPVDIDDLAETAPRPCRFIYAETATFGPDLAEFHKTTYQDPPKGALISEGAAAYRDVETARRAFGALAATVEDCAASSAGQLYVGEWKADDGSLHLRPGGCGRDYRVLSIVIVEVTFCGFPQSVSEIVMTNIAANVPN